MGDLNFGAEVLWVSRVKLPANWGTKPHHHEFYHFTYVISGSGVWKVDGEEIRASAGDCINVPPHIAHSMELDNVPGEIIEITTGNSITLEPYVFHRFFAKTGCGDLLIGEVSKINDDNTDNMFAVVRDRFCGIDEDEAPYRLLVNEY